MEIWRRNDEIRILLTGGGSDGVMFHHGDGGPRWIITAPAWEEWQSGARQVSGIVYREPRLTIAAGPGLTADPVYHRVSPGILVPRSYRWSPPDFGFDADGRRLG